MKDVLADILKHTIGIAPVLRVIGTKTKTQIKGAHESNVLFVEGELRNPIGEFEGEFGLSNLGLLKGLLEFASYRTDKASFSVKRMVVDGSETVEQLRFRDENGVGSDYRATSPKALPPNPTIPAIPWDVTLTPSKAKQAEFQKLASLFKDIPTFGARTDGANLIFSFGSANDASNHGEMVFASGVAGVMKGTVVWPTATFIQLMNLAGDNDAAIRLTNRGVIGVDISNDHAMYKYFLRGSSAS